MTIFICILGLDLIRKIEVHRARVVEVQDIKVYFLSFHNSVEEQIYLTSIQREKRAFETLIQEKGTMVQSDKSCFKKEYFKNKLYRLFQMKEKPRMSLIKTCGETQLKQMKP